MKCKDCGESLRGKLILECSRCGYLPGDCDCKGEVGWTPDRRVSCFNCDRTHVAKVDTTTSGWQGMEV